MMLAHLLAALLVLHSAAAADPLPPPAEQRALLELRSSLGISAKNWHKKTNPCLNWTGIHCLNGHVTSIELSSLRRSIDGKLNPRFSVDALQSLPSLSSFVSAGFPLPGPIPDWFASKLTSLRVLHLTSASISGPVPASLGSFSALTSLNLSNNSITGNIPISMANLPNLTSLDLSLNSFTGQIPPEISSLRNLTALDLSSNYLSGAIPLDFAMLSKLKRLNLSRNSLSSSIPSQIASISEMEELDLGFNSLSGLLPPELGELKSLRYLDVSRNNITGALPNRAASFNATAAFFNFSGNFFDGNVTSAFENARVVDLSGNYFRGKAPNTSRFLISGNCFSGEEGQRGSEECSEFYNGGSWQPMVPTSVEQPREEKKGRNRVKTFLLIGAFSGVGLIFIFAAALVLLLLLRRSRRNRGSESRDVEQEPPKFVADLGEAFTLEQLLVATGNFSDENLIKEGHSGWLFRGRLEGGELVVVKRVDVRTVGREMLVAEVEFLGKSAHQRLVPLVGHCLDEDENVKFLVYRYMPNGDLSNALYRLTSSEEGLQSLDWITRLKIAIGAAEALSYLHNDCNPPLVHRDVQASSILLDDKYEVRLGSFSEVCASGANDHQNMVARLTSGGRRQPSGSPSATCAYDVYCLGKVLLELVTGKFGISTMSEGDAQQWLDSNLPFISMYEKEMVNKIVDQSLIVDEDLLEEVWAVAVVAKSCLNPKAWRRPSVRHVVKALENPFKVVRDENFSSGRLRRGPSRQSWTAALFGSWHNSSSGSSNVSSQTNKEIIGGLRQTERAGSRGSGTNDHSSSHKRSSSDVFPQPLEMQDAESAN